MSYFQAQKLFEYLFVYFFPDLSTLRFYYNLGLDVSSTKSYYTCNAFFFIAHIYGGIVYNNILKAFHSDLIFCYK